MFRSSDTDDLETCCDVWDLCMLTYTIRLGGRATDSASHAFLITISMCTFQGTVVRNSISLFCFGPRFRLPPVYPMAMHVGLGDPRLRLECIFRISLIVLPLKKQPVSRCQLAEKCERFLDSTRFSQPVLVRCWQSLTIGNE